MAYCNNCNKTGLRKADVEFCDSTRQMLCHGCYSLAHPGWMPPSEIVDMTQEQEDRRPKIGFAIQITDEEGVRAQVSYGGFTFSIQAPAEDIRKLIGN
jgi:hypothetical protein